MLAARLHEIGTSLKVEEVPEPALKPGGAIVRVLASHVPNFMSGIVSGKLDYYVMPLPFIPGPGAIAVVEAVADDVFGLEVGQKVFCDINMATKSNNAPPEKILIGITALTPNAGSLQQLWRDGTFAEKVCYPAECLTPLEGAADVEPTTLASLNFLTIAYGGLLRGEVRPAQTLIVNGATGCMGASAVLVSLAMGVAKVVAVARNQETLDTLVQLDPKRVTSVALAGNAEDAEKVKAASGGADVLLDCLGAVKDADPVLACINALSPGGTAVFIGGVQAEIPLPYFRIMIQELTIRGAFMYPRQVPKDLLRMISTGTLNLNAIKTHVFPLDKVNDAVSKAATLRGLEYSIVVPNSNSF
ncbi:MAG: zinc-binding dehydrogenase [Rhizonema sp. PD38]|nr:zinc-binding dehydrogenase [Rhizonema sp. PD38]